MNNLRVFSHDLPLDFFPKPSKSIEFYVIVA